MSFSRVRSFIAVGTLLATTGTLFAATAPTGTSGKISPDLAAQPSNAKVPVIIQYYNAPSSLETGLLGLLGGLIKTVLSPIHALVVTLLPGQLNQIIADPNVKYVSLDRVLKAMEPAILRLPEPGSKRESRARGRLG